MILYLVTLISVVSTHVLDTLLKSYDTLDRDDLDIRYYPGNIIVVSLKLEGQTYTSTLSPHLEIFHKHFKTVLIDSNSTSRLSNPTDGHYIGQIDSVEDSRVVVHVDPGGLITGNVELNEELFYIEPSWRHISEPHDFHMITYKKSDVLYNLGHPETGNFCGHAMHDHADLSTYVFPMNRTKIVEDGFEYGSRFKRATKPKDTCEVVLIADNKFYSTIGGSNELQTKTYLIAIFERINHIFKTTAFETTDRKFHGHGMQIRTIVIHTSPSSDRSSYNHKKAYWDVSDMLDAFGYGTAGLSDTWSEYCLAHLYTNYDFTAGVLGLAYVASPVRNKVGGICSLPYTSGNTFRKRMLNIGLSTSVNYDRTLLSSELELVSAHEIGHNWGSSHDPDNTDLCAPPGNHFLMYPSAVDGARPNNKRFSPCSKTAIASVLKYKSSCFVERSTSFCGNGIIEDDEDCDAGPDKQFDSCCTDKCEFLPGAVCSDHNTECCVDCRLAGVTKTCYESSGGDTLDIINSCIKEKRCNATSATCSTITYKDTGSPCFDEGSCGDNGQCLDFCATKGLTLCQGHGNNSCYWMCEDPADGKCSLKYSHLPDGKPCPNGFCDKGVCVLEPQTQVKIWRILRSLTPSLFWQWMKNNVVLVVIVVTSVFWVPLSIFVHWLDKGHDQMDYHTTMTLQRTKGGVKTQMSTVSSKSFELTQLKQVVSLKPILDLECATEDVFSLTGERF